MLSPLKGKCSNRPFFVITTIQRSEASVHHNSKLIEKSHKALLSPRGSLGVVR